MENTTTYPWITILINQLYYKSKAVRFGQFFYFWAIHFFFRIFAPENSLFITNY